MTIIVFNMRNIWTTANEKENSQLGTWRITIPGRFHDIDPRTPWLYMIHLDDTHSLRDAEKIIRFYPEASYHVAS